MVNGLIVLEIFIDLKNFLLLNISQFETDYIIKSI